VAGRMRCGSARSGPACAKGSDWPGARDPSDPLRPHRCVGWRAMENPTGSWVRRRVFDASLQRGGSRLRAHRRRGVATTGFHGTWRQRGGLGRRPVQKMAALWIRGVPLRRGDSEARRGRRGRRCSARQACAWERARFGLVKVQAWGKKGRRRGRGNRCWRVALRVRACALPEGQRRKPDGELRSWAT
jgi:hypothetical protein